MLGPRDELSALGSWDAVGEISKNAEEILTILNREMAGNHVFAGIAVVAISQAAGAPFKRWDVVLRHDSVPRNSSFISLVGRLNARYRLLLDDG